MSDRDDISTKMKELGFITHDSLSYGDYDNSCAVERANVRALKEHDHYAETFETVGYTKFRIGTPIEGAWTPYAPDPETTMIILEGGYGSCEAWIKGDEIGYDIVAGLRQHYPAIDDQLVSEIESELEQEAFDNWIREDIRRAMATDEGKDLFDALTESDTRAMFHEAKDSCNEYGHVESGGSWWIDVKKITPYIETKILYS